MPIKIYIAGPDVFERNASELGKRYQSACSQKEAMGLFPLDNEVSFENKKPEEVALDIYKGNLAMIRESDIIIANLNPFRSSVEPDSGTVFEVGYANALGKPVFGYINDARAYLLRYMDQHPVTKESKITFDGDGKIIEDFNLPLNLMLSCSITLVEGGFEDALKAALKK